FPICNTYKFISHILSTHHSSYSKACYSNLFYLALTSPTFPEGINKKQLKRKHFCIFCSFRVLSFKKANATSRCYSRLTPCATTKVHRTPCALLLTDVLLKSTAHLVLCY